MKKNTIIATVLASILLIGCGTESNNNEKKVLTAKEILVGKTMYSADADLDEPTGYYRDMYSANQVIETEHAEDGTSIYEPIVFQASYNKDTITVSLGTESKTCKVTQITHGVQFVCDDGMAFSEWNAISNIQR